ncbi:MAG: hypothetical protein EBZ48_09560 [Proteobacteria bacterium]|nr:hypothetical protein [Pseudomonadota bacterium]
MAICLAPEGILRCLLAVERKEHQMAILRHTHTPSTLTGVAIGAVAMFELASLPGCSTFPEYSPPSSTARAPAYPTDKHDRPERIEKQGSLWRSWIVPDSTVTLIHMRNHHLAGFTSPDAPEAATYWEAQRQMFALMDECTSRYTISALYGDGATDKYIELYNREIALQRSHLGGNKPTDLPTLLRGASESLKAQGALAGYALLHDMQLNAGESFELHQRARAARMAKSPGADDLVLRQREDFLLSRIFADFPKGNVTVMTTFGADHLLWDNVRRWNEENPKYKISLIEVSAHKVRELGFELPSQQ